jgi:hypothetical protein
MVFIWLEDFGMGGKDVDNFINPKGQEHETWLWVVIKIVMVEMVGS